MRLREADLKRYGALDDEIPGIAGSMLKLCCDSQTGSDEGAK